IIMISCLFCAEPCPTSFVVVDGKVTQVKSENEFITADNLGGSVGSESLRFGEDPPIIGEHLKVIFVLSRILGVREEKLCEFIREGEGFSYLETWVNLCNSCGESVNQCFKIIKEISRLERRLKEAKDELKGNIVGSKDARDSYSTTTQESSSDGFQPEPDLLESKIVDKRNGQLNLDSGIPDISLPDSSNVPVAISDPPVEPPQKIRKWPYSCPYCTYSSGLRHFYVRHLRLHQESSPILSSSPINKKLIPSGSSSKYSYKCEQCPFGSTSKQRWVAHLVVHAKGSGAVPCPNCEWHILPHRMARHQSKSHPTLYQRVLKKRMTVAHKLQPIQPPPLVTAPVLKTGVKKKHYYYKCDRCPFNSSCVTRFRSHEKTHELGSPAKPCSDCGVWILPGRQLAFHQTTVHHIQGNKRKKLNITKRMDDKDEKHENNDLVLDSASLSDSQPEVEFVETKIFHFGSDIDD
ncbi:putative zinc finger protein, partial [Orchesella cincta]